MSLEQTEKAEMSALMRQVFALAQTNEAMIQRQEQVFKLVEEQSKLLVGLIDNLTVLSEALRKSLSESDQQIDDLGQVTLALTTVYNELKEDEQAE